MIDGKLFIDGEWVGGQLPVAEIHSPWDDSLVGTIPVAGEPELERAIAAAVRAFRTTRLLPRWKRSQICRSISEAIAACGDDFADLISRESGKPIQYARGEVNRAVSTFAIAAEEANRLTGEIVPLDITPASEGYAGMSLRVPCGPVAAISPFNFPLNLVAHKVAPALAAGCPVVLKPPPQAPLTSLKLAEVVSRSGAPEGALSVLHLELPLAEQLATDERFALLSFTGSARVGWHLKSIAGRKRVLLELGGNAGAIVCEDADRDWALRRCVISSFAAAGQVCIKLQRLFVQRSIYTEFVNRFVEEARRVISGDPMGSATVVGPVIDDRSVTRIMEWLDEAKANGARVLCGGDREGRLISPTVIEGARPEMKIVCEEVFGPVVVVCPFDEFDEALRLVNASSYGLQAAVFTRDLVKVRQAAEELEVGGVIVNDFPMFRVDNFPYGGVKGSGLGREGVRYAMEEMTDIRMIVVNLRS